jgi:hypothetical protein
MLAGYIERDAPVGPSIVVGRRKAIGSTGRALARSSGRRRLVGAEQILELGTEGRDWLNRRAVCVFFWWIVHGAVLWVVRLVGDFVVSRHQRVCCSCSLTTEMCFPFGAGGGHAGTGTEDEDTGYGRRK